MQVIRRYDAFENPTTLCIPEKDWETRALLRFSIEFQQAIRDQQTTIAEMEKQISRNLELIRKTRDKLNQR